VVDVDVHLLSGDRHFGGVGELLRMGLTRIVVARVPTRIFFAVATCYNRRKRLWLQEDQPMEWTVDIQSAVRRAILRAARRLEVPRARVMVAVSGGLDSMVLLHAARECTRSSPVDVAAVHVNHHLRPTSHDDAKFVERMCRDWDIPLEIRDVHLAEVARADRRGTEADARRLRYAALVEAARKLSAHCVLLAHHADDQIETVLWRLVRGASLTGLSGMRAEGEREGVVWLRPLLNFDKAALSAYAREWEIPHVEDESNFDTTYTRNYLRHRVVPELKRLQPNLAQVVVQASRFLREDDDFLNQLAEQALGRIARKVEAGFEIDLQAFSELARPLQRRAIKILLYCFTSSEWTSTHIEGILALADHQSPSAEMSLPGGLCARREYDCLRIGQFPQHAGDRYRLTWRPEAGDRLEIPIAGGCWELTCDVIPGMGDRMPRNHWELAIPRVEAFVVRTAQPGDRVRVLGLNGSKKVQDLFVDAKVPRWQRTSWPLLEVDGKIVWVPGITRAEHFLVGEEDRDVFLISARRISDFMPSS
jgi:tRNA(Ile)-lysidine synthetase-like protein